VSAKWFRDWIATTCLLVALVLFLPVVWAHNLGQELTSASPAVQPNGRPQPTATQPAPPPLEASSPKITTYASVTKPALSGATLMASAQTEQSQNGAAKSPRSTAPAKADESVFTVRKTVREVYLVFTVTDQHGHYVKSLKKNDFKILDDGKAPEILSFSSETDLPLQVGLLIDASQSVTSRFKFEQEAAIEFLKQTIRPSYDQALVIGFDLTPKVTQDFTDDTEKLSVAIRAMRPGTLTAMYDVLYYACRDKLLKQPRTGPVRRAIILLSDGNDNSSVVTREKAVEMAQRSEVSLYTISIHPTASGGEKKGNKALEYLAEATGGRSYAPSAITELKDVFAAIQEDLRSQYVVSYKPAAFTPDGHFRTIEVQAHTQKGLCIRSRKGYRSPAEYDAPNK
jgi:Ca-activated chloride channel homolog